MAYDEGGLDLGNCQARIAAENAINDRRMSLEIWKGEMS